MTNNQLIIKLKKETQMRIFFHYIYDRYLGKTKDIMKCFGEMKLRNYNIRIYT